MRRDRIRPFQCTWEKIDSVDESHASLPLLILGHLPLAYCRGQWPIYAHFEVLHGCVVETVILVKSALLERGSAVMSGIAVKMFVGGPL
jgi:hypothetical protein